MVEGTESRREEGKVELQQWLSVFLYVGVYLGPLAVAAGQQTNLRPKESRYFQLSSWMAGL